MTLYKQLITWILAAFILLIIAVIAIQFTFTRQYLEDQQRSEINNTVNAMGLALSPYLQDNDKVAVESVINALFDGGYYQMVQVKMLSTGESVIRQYPTKITTVPSWFTNLHLFKTFTESRILTSGWQQTAEIVVIAHPGYAYQQLWQAISNLFWGFITVFIFTALMISALLSYTLKPLQAIKKKAEEVAQNKFSTLLKTPTTRDLIPLVNAMNKMSAQVEKHFEQQAQEANRLRKQAYQDPISGLANRDFFIGQIKNWLAESSTGGIAFFKVNQIQSFYENSGYQVGDQAVCQLANNFKAKFAESNFTIARISQCEFALLAPEVTKDELLSLGEHALNSIIDLQPDPTAMSPIDAQIGLVHNHGEIDISTLLTLADNALVQASLSPNKPIALLSESNRDEVLGKQQWVQLVIDSIRDDNLVYRFQTVSDSQGNTIHCEVFTSIEIDNHRYSANQFLSAIEHADEGETFDKHVIDTIINKLNNNQELPPIAVNLTHSSVIKPTFLRWLNSRLDANKQLQQRIQFEIPETIFVHHPDSTALLCDSLHQRGVAFGVDNYGRYFSSPEYLSEFRPHYVKIDFIYTNELDSEHNRNVLASISRAAHNLDITTIATRVETQQQLTKLSEHFVNGFQGFIFEQKGS
ncbi:MAG: EAL domain-containing protein [Aliivibrio sp.]|uniref:bifunctional diguanylate cyclase/phosphodiesterase n=1 Tax=Aliivibrio sp. TaxID=1872443 RepID=UPI001A40DF3E|nr:EAL domain-containing protein [Aliivibrio sp.]